MRENRAEALIERAPGVPGIKLTLDRLQGVLDSLGNPERRLPPVVHVAGTNGKGSTIAYLRAIYEAADKRVHCYTSPHLVSYHERIVLAGAQVGDAQLCDAVERVLAAEANHVITIFERITAAAYLCFSEVEADVLLLETGLGGQWDATNVTPKIATVLTPVAYDHMEFLGDKLEGIAAEKAAIMRHGVPCISAIQSDAAQKVIADYASAIGAPLYWVQQHPKLKPSLLGAHQMENAMLAATTAKILGLSDEAIDQGISHAMWPARLQRLSYGPFVQAWGARGDVLLDGGHNAHAAAALAQWIQAQDRPITLLCGLMARKSAKGWLEQLVPHVQNNIFCGLGDVDAYPPEALMAEAQALGAEQTQGVAGLVEAEELLSRSPVSRGHLLIAGSLYLAGDILKSHG